MALKQRMWKKECLKKRLDFNHESHLRGLDMFHGWIAKFNYIRSFLRFCELLEIITCASQKED
jgi:hypothetical protein